MLDLERVRQAVATPAPAPLHLRLRQAIQAQIVDGTLQPGEALPSERGLQQELGLSRATVRQALGALIQAGLLQSVPGTSTFVSERPEPTRRGMVGLIVGSVNFHFFYPQLAGAFSHRLRQGGYGMVMSLHNDHSETLDAVVEDLLAQGVVGLAVTPPRYGSVDQLAAQLMQRGVPLVMIGRRGHGAVDCVASDNEQIGYSATSRLIECGHRTIAHLGFLDYSTGADRAAGYRRAMTEAGLTPHVVELASRPEPAAPAGAPAEHLSEPAAEAALALWGAGAIHPTAAFCFNDIVTMAVYKTLRGRGLRIPEDISLVGVDNLPTVRHFEVPLATFALPSEEIGRLAADLLLRRLSGENPAPRVHLLTARPIPGASISALAPTSLERH
jgi:DNA-binding LacI/PurR family transcriptional regulator